jgi:ribosomal protein S18 acetylase RimI-like enzyme
VLIRPAAENDLESVYRVDRLVFGRLAYPFFAWRQLMDLHSRHCLVADDGEQLVGYCLGALAARPLTGWILGLAVLPSAREAGHGRHLVHETVRRIAADGAREVRLAVEPENSAAIHLYETLGFRICGFRPDYFGPEGDRLIMTTDGGRLDAAPPRGDRLDAWWG